MQHKRAIDEKEKLERRGIILAAAMDLFMSSSFDSVNMQAVADKAGIAKGTTYLYFKTKEELFLALLNEELAAWLKALRTRLSDLADDPLPLSDKIDEFSARVATSLEKQPGLMRLIPLVHAILDHNIDAAAALTYKRRLRMRFMTAGLQIEDVLTFLKAGQGAELLLTIYSLLIGLQGMAEPAPAVAQALLEPDLSLFRIEMTPTLTGLLIHLLTGIAVEAGMIYAEY
jgi:AcrR family transcriptional regulator